RGAHVAGRGAGGAARSAVRPTGVDGATPPRSEGMAATRWHGRGRGPRGHRGRPRRRGARAGVRGSVRAEGSGRARPRRRGPRAVIDDAAIEAAAAAARSGRLIVFPTDTV